MAFTIAVFHTSAWNGCRLVIKIHEHNFYFAAHFVSCYHYMKVINNNWSLEILYSKCEHQFVRLIFCNKFDGELRRSGIRRNDVIALRD